MTIAILPSTIAVPRLTNPSLSSVRFLSGFDRFGFRPISIDDSGGGRLVIRNGGGPRTFPGGVSKWQWKRMQANKAKQLLKARLLRERQIYEMRKRAELKAAVSELERPWELVEMTKEKTAPKLFSIAADEQVKALADRFQRPGGFDMWTERDGPQVFQSPEGLPSARFFPKGVVHSVKPYGIVGGEDDDGEDVRFDDWVARGGGGIRRRRRRERRNSNGGDGVGSDGESTQDVCANALSLNELKITRNVSEEQGNRSSESNGRSRNGGNGRRRGFNDSLDAKPVDAPNYRERRRGVRDNALSSDGSKITRGRASNDRKASEEWGSRSYGSNVRSRNDGNGSRRGFNGSFKPDGAASYDREEGSEVERRGRSRSGGNRRFKEERVSLRPTSDLYSEDDGFQF
ncbi:uncharacterized protein [Typha angustifolia]|uniref:uncharacterized protein n=1 Tax=Typha angustifolia TaxID=59011 RepID=UPI003C2E6DB3